MIESIMDGISLVVIFSQKATLIDALNQVKDSQLGYLATTKFIDSRLVYESYADGTKDIDLVSQQVSIDWRLNLAL